MSGFIREMSFLSVTQTSHTTWTCPPVPYTPHTYTVFYPKAHIGWLGWERFQHDPVFITRSSHLQKRIPWNCIRRTRAVFPLFHGHFSWRVEENSCPVLPPFLRNVTKYWCSEETDLDHTLRGTQDKCAQTKIMGICPVLSTSHSWPHAFPKTRSNWICPLLQNAPVYIALNL